MNLKKMLMGLILAFIGFKAEAVEQEWVNKNETTGHTVYLYQETDLDSYKKWRRAPGYKEEHLPEINARIKGLLTDERQKESTSLYKILNSSGECEGFFNGGYLSRNGLEEFPYALKAYDNNVGKQIPTVRTFFANPKYDEAGQWSPTQDFYLTILSFMKNTNQMTFPVLIWTPHISEYPKDFQSQTEVQMLLALNKLNAGYTIQNIDNNKEGFLSGGKKEAPALRNLLIIQETKKQ